MLDTWFNVTMLATESQQVVSLRLWKLAWGGSAAVGEAHDMVVEKVTAGTEAAVRLLFGASPDSIVSDYRERVQANARRLA